MAKRKMLLFSVCITVVVLSFALPHSFAQEHNILVSPDGRISVRVFLERGVPRFTIMLEQTPVMESNRLGIRMEEDDFADSLTLVSVSATESIDDQYTLLHGKKIICSYRAQKKVFRFENEKRKEMHIIFHASNDGVAFRYFFPETTTKAKRITEELTSFNFDDSTSVWIQPVAPARSGWCGTNPSFEEHYIHSTIKHLPKSESGWMMLPLLHSGKFWISLTETAPDRNYCGGRLIHDSLSTELKIGFPQQAEAYEDGAVTPVSTLPWYTPWRIITLSDTLATLVESTLGTDLAEPCRLGDVSFVKPGRASWSWVLLKDDSTVYSVQKRFIDYAAEMGWEYCLIDAFWDTKIGYEKLAELCSYATTKNVGILVWYNSAGNWNTTPLTPRDKLLTHELRDAEFRKLKDIGVKGVKVDFFGGEGQSFLTYYQDIFEDAARYGLMVNCHGATYPRGWYRTYPNLVTMEAIRGFEFVTFDQYNADKQAEHCTIIPFTRNLFDPMDFTPVCFSEIPNIERKTTNSFELALSVLFLSGIQHFAEIPEGMKNVPAKVREILRNIPVAWDESKFVDGYPGRHIIIARRKGQRWYIAGINGESVEKKLLVDIKFISMPRENILVTSGNNTREFAITTAPLDLQNPLSISLGANDGFLLIVTTE